MKFSFPPFLRGVGAAVMLLATIIAFFIARQHDPRQPANAAQAAKSAAQDSEPSLASVSAELHELRAKVDQVTVVDDVLENVWFEVASIVGATIVTASFFAESYVRSEKQA